MEALIHHFKIFTEGFKVPEGETYVAVESPRGRAGLLHRFGRRSHAVPHAHPGALVREPPDAAAPHARDSLIADAVAIISSVDPIMGEVDR
jgi:NADH-quinone oxidoreductase subunit D